MKRLLMILLLAAGGVAAEVTHPVYCAGITDNHSLRSRRTKGQTDHDGQG